MTKKVVFISLPMSRLSDEKIEEQLKKAKRAYLDQTQTDIREIAFDDNFNRVVFEPADFEVIQEGREPLFYLSGALGLMACCDEVFLYGNWEEARGCRVENYVCELYGVPHVYWNGTESET